MGKGQNNTLMGEKKEEYNRRLAILVITQNQNLETGQKEEEEEGERFVLTHVHGFKTLQKEKQRNKEQSKLPRSDL
jgi:hypothetical protein